MKKDRILNSDGTRSFGIDFFNRTIDETGINRIYTMNRHARRAIEKTTRVKDDNKAE